MLKELTRILILQLFFFVIANTGQAENSDMSLVFKATEKLMDKEISQFYATHNQVELLNYMKKFNDTQGVARLTEKLSAHSPTVKDIGTFTFYEKHIALALQYLGQKDYYIDMGHM